MADLFASLSVGERLFIYRKRAKISQSEMARNYGISRSTYGRIERDELDDPNVRAYVLGGLLPNEEAMIIRRRNNETQKEVATRIGLSRHWVSKMETGQAACDRLIGVTNGTTV